MIRDWARYAPSPTGPLHLGNLQTALAAWLQARLAGAGFILRIEDLDTQRCRDEYTESIVADLEWLGIDWDVGPGVTPAHTYLQSARYDLYRATLETLARGGRLYPCTCSRRDLREMASAPHGPLGQVYPGTCRAAVPENPWTWGGLETGAQSVRFLCSAGPRVLHDWIVGEIECDISRDVGDFVVFRRDGVVAYHLAVVADDIDMGITDVLRGEDLLWSAFPQGCLYEALGVEPPRYWHVPLRLDESGERLAKRTGGATLKTLVDAGYSREAVVGMLAHGLGLVDDQPPIPLDELLAGLDSARFTQLIQKKRASARSRDRV